MKKKFVFSVIALVAAAAGVAWTIAKLLKRNGQKLNKDLDYDDYYLDEDYGSGDEAVMAETEPEEESFEDLIADEVEPDTETEQDDSELE